LNPRHLGHEVGTLPLDHGGRLPCPISKTQIVNFNPSPLYNTFHISTVKYYQYPQNRNSILKQEAAYLLLTTTSHSCSMLTLPTVCCYGKAQLHNFRDFISLLHNSLLSDICSIYKKVLWLCTNSFLRFWWICTFPAP
jgi:hypothetical protein